MVSNVLYVIFWGGKAVIFYVANELFCVDDHGIEVPSESEQKEPGQLKSILCLPNCNLLLT